MEKKNRLNQLIDSLKAGSPRGLAKAISFVENKEDGLPELMNFAYKNMRDKALVIGITGPGGAGKSTLVDKIIKQFRKQGKRVGVIAVDPSSPYSGGAFLGDRVRMGVHSMDEDVFIRSFASRGSMGGISQGTKQCLYLFKNYDFDVIIIESLGIGQDETEISNFVDVTVVTVVPGYGDSIQIAKAGMQEIADIFVINKADKPGAEEFYHQMLSSLEMLPEDLRPLILKTVASTGDGVLELVDAIVDLGEKYLPKRKDKNRLRIIQEIKSEVAFRVNSEIGDLIERKAQSVFDGSATPFEVTDEIFHEIEFNKT
jgi:LAO/AO transport system kinase